MSIRTGLIVAMVCMSLPAAAQNPFEQNPFRVEEVGDEELAQLRGRFVLPDRVVHFGVTMTTLWENSAGRIGAQVQFQMNAGSQPSLHMSFLDEMGSDAPFSQGAGQVIGGAGLDSVQGVVQSVRNAGDYNDALNDLNITIGTSAAPTLDGQAWNGPMAAVNDAGNVQITRQAGGLQIAVQANHGQGYARQLLGGGQMAQQSNISGNLNKVVNAADLNVVLRNAALGSQLAQCAWEQLRGLQTTGY